MEWNIYKDSVDASRRLIVFPFFEKHLSAKEGVGVDIGSGNGDLTARIARLSSGTVVGIDKNEKLLSEARSRYNDLHFVRGDVDKNVLPTIGLTIDYAFSNCCFCHISDEGMYGVLMDLYSCMRDDGELYSWCQVSLGPKTCIAK